MDELNQEIDGIERESGSEQYCVNTPTYNSQDVDEFGNLVPFTTPSCYPSSKVIGQNI